MPYSFCSYYIFSKQIAYIQFASDISARSVKHQSSIELTLYHTYTAQHEIEQFHYKSTYSMQTYEKMAKISLPIVAKLEQAFKPSELAICLTHKVLM